jgi:hypothetical protein
MFSIGKQDFPPLGIHHLHLLLMMLVLPQTPIVIVVEVIAKPPELMESVPAMITIAVKTLSLNPRPRKRKAMLPCEVMSRDGIGKTEGMYRVVEGELAADSRELSEDAEATI